MLFIEHDLWFRFFLSILIDILLTDKPIILLLVSLIACSFSAACLAFSKEFKNKGFKPDVVGYILRLWYKVTMLDHQHKCIYFSEWSVLPLLALFLVFKQLTVIKMCRPRSDNLIWILQICIQFLPKLQIKRENVDFRESYVFFTNEYL